VEPINQLRGRQACTNNMELPMVRVDQAILATIEQDLLWPEVWTVAVQKAIERLRTAAPDLKERRHALHARIQDLWTTSSPV